MRGQRGKQPAAAVQPDGKAAAVIERILRRLGLWQQGVRVDSGPDPPGELVVEPCFDDILPDYDTDMDLVYANSARAGRCRPGGEETRFLINQPTSPPGEKSLRLLSSQPSKQATKT